MENAAQKPTKYDRFGFLQGVLTQEAHEAIQARELDSVEHLLMAGFHSGRCRLDQR
jgi:hypothetical protein